MKKTSAKKFLFKGMIAIAFAFILFIGFIFNPSFSYAHQSSIAGVQVYHNQALAPAMNEIIQESLSILKQSQLYDENLVLKLCMQEGSSYPTLIKRLMGDDVIRSFSNINVVLAKRSDSPRFLAWKGHRFKYSQFLAHVMVHNLQYQHHGFWDANPLGGYPEWKWEGYADYVALGKKYDLSHLWKAYQETKKDPFSFVSLEAGEGSIRLHIRYLLLTKFCLDHKEMDYDTFMNTELNEEDIWAEILEESGRNLF